MTSSFLRAETTATASFGASRSSRRAWSSVNARAPSRRRQHRDQRCRRARAGPPGSRAAADSREARCNAEVERGVGVDRRPPVGGDPSDHARRPATSSGRAASPRARPRRTRRRRCRAVRRARTTRSPPTAAPAAASSRQRADVGDARLAAGRAREAADGEQLVRRPAIPAASSRPSPRLSSRSRPGIADRLGRRVDERFGRHQPLVRRDEHVDDRRVVHRAAPLARICERRVVGHPRAVRTIGRQRVEAVDDRQDARADAGCRRRAGRRDTRCRPSSRDGAGRSGRPDTESRSTRGSPRRSARAASSSRTRPASACPAC